MPSLLIKILGGNPTPLLIGPSENPILGLADSLLDQIIWPPDFEPPIAVLAVLLVDLPHSPSKLQGFDDALLNESRSFWRLHHLGSDVATGQNGSEWGGGGMEQIGLVEEPLVQLDLL